LMAKSAGGDAYLSAEDRARVEIDKQLVAAGWAVQRAHEVNLGASLGVAVREFVLQKPHGRADYLLFVDRVPVGDAATTTTSAPCQASPTMLTMRLPGCGWIRASTPTVSCS
jgi:type I site-specific restriction endonuclease